MHAKIIINGNVQGVYFRETAVRKAEALSLTGYIRNEPDGTVSTEVEGKETDINKYIAWCSVGPEQAEVKAVNVSYEDMVGFQGFKKL